MADIGDGKGERKIYHWLLSTVACPKTEETWQSRQSNICTGAQNLQTPPRMYPRFEEYLGVPLLVTGDDVVARGKRKNSSQWSIKTVNNMM